MTRCGHCGHYHDSPCPRIKAIEYHPGGSVRRIEYFEPDKPINKEVASERHPH